MTKVMKLACVALLGFVSISVWAQKHAADSTAPGKAAAPETQAVPVTPGAPADYSIGPDDMLRIAVWKEPDMNATLPVRPDGKISLPLLDDVQAAGLTPLQLKDSITEKLKKYIADPHVTVVVTAMNSQRIFVTGEVTHTGAIPLLPNMTILQALASAGFTQFANLKGIYLLRMENGRQVKLPFNYKDVVKGRHPEQNITLRPGDTVVVP
jgi:polysaccharide export outer membrane protein